MSISTHKTAIGLTNRSFSTTDYSSMDKRDEEFLRLTTEYSYSEPGNIIPHFWFKQIVDEKARPDLTAITLLSEILALYRFSNSTPPCSYLVKRTCNETTLVGKVLRTSYEHFSQKFMIRKEKARRGFLRLEELGIITRGVCNISLEEGGRCNKLMITIDQEFFCSCFRRPELDIRAHKSGLPYSLRDQEVKDNFSTDKDSENNVISSDDNKFQSLQISYHHISNKNKIKKDRSMIYASSEAQSRSSFLENSLDLKEKANNNHNNFLEISTSSVDKNNNALALQILSNTKFNSNTDNQFSSQVKNPSIDKKLRKLKDFYPLSAMDCNELQKLSGRDFSLNAMNEILNDMSRRLTHPIFYSKKGFISYMANAFRKEMRDAVKTSNESFKIKANQSLEENRAEEIENYLTEIEYSTQVSPEWHLKKKLACVLEATKAYNLLKAYRSIAIEGDTAKIHLYKPIQLSQGELDLVLAQVKATHERFENGKYNPIQKIELIMPKVANKNQSSYKTNSKLEKLPNSLWGRVRSALIGIYGEAIDISWFSKLEATEDTEEKAINLKASSEFIKDWIERNYEQGIEQTAETMGIRINRLEC